VRLEGSGRGEGDGRGSKVNTITAGVYELGGGAVALWLDESGSIRLKVREPPGGLASAIDQYDLRFSVSTAPAAEADTWLSSNGNVVFKFWVTDFPTLIRFSGNNPALPSS
jgi:hypothetical protein